MNTFRVILPISAFVVAIVCFWLLPNINKATTLKYTRVYEDTETRSQERTPVAGEVLKEPASLAPSETPKIEPVKALPEVRLLRAKKYKKESIEVNRSWRKVNPKMFSRAVHFLEEEVVLDSIGAVADTAQPVQ